MRNRTVLLACSPLLAALLIAPDKAAAQTQTYWDPTLTYSTTGGGAGTWNTANVNWWVSGASDSVWADNSIANFGGTPGTVTLGAAVTANGLAFACSNYNISGTSTLTLAGTPAISLPTGTNTISCSLASTVPVTVTGPGTLSLTKANTSLTGGVTISPGTTVAVTSVTGAGTGTIADNGTLSVTVGASTFSAPIAGEEGSIVNVNLPYKTSSQNIRYAATATANFHGTFNVIAGLSGGSPGAGQVILSEGESATCTWNVGSGATLVLARRTDGTTYPYAANVTLNGPGNSQPYGALRVDSVTLTGNVLLNGPGITLGNYVGPAEISGVISDGGQHFGFTRVCIRGMVITLSGANTYSGPTVFGSDIIQVGSAEVPGVSGPLGASAGSNPGSIVMSGGTLQYSSVNQFDYSGRFSTNSGQAYNIDVDGQAVNFATPLTSSGGSLSLSDSIGGGTLTLSAKNTYNGGTTITAGTLRITGSIASTAITANGGTLELDTPSALASSTVMTLPATPNSAMVNLNFSGVQNIASLSYGTTAMAPGTYGSIGNASVQYQDPTFIGNGILNVQPPSYWDPAHSALSPGSGGSGVWDNTSANWLVGTSDTAWVSNNIANFAGNPGTVTLNANVTAGGLSFLATGYTLNGGSTLTLSGTPAITLSGGASAEIDCPIAGTAGFTANGSGTLTLKGTNTFTGAVTLGNSCSVVLSGPNAYAGPTTLDYGSYLTITGSGNLAGGAYPGNIINEGMTLTYSSTAPQTLSGVISGAGYLEQQGPGPLTLGGFNTFSGAITISGGTLSVTGDLGNNVTFNTGNYSGNIVNDGAFVFNSPAAQTLSGTLSGSGTLTQSGTAPLTLSGYNGNSGSVVIGAGSELIISGTGVLGYGDYTSTITNNGTFTYGSSSAQILEGAISGSGALTLSGTGLLTLNGQNTYTGATTISKNTLALGSTGSLGPSPLSIAAGTTLDVSAVPTPYVFTGTNLSAAGTKTVSSTIIGPVGGMVNLGAAPVSLTFVPQTFNGDTTHPALVISQGDLTLNGNVVTVRNSGGSALGAGTYTVAQVPGGSAHGTAVLARVTGAGLARNCAASLAVNSGTLDLVVVPVPSFGSFTFSGGTLTLSGTNGTAGAIYYVLTSTNASLPLSQWKSIATNTFNTDGTFTATMTPTASPSFFGLKLP